MPQMKKIALFDMDSTLCDYEGQMYKDLLAIQSPSDPALEIFERDRPEWLENRMDLVKKQPGWWRNLPRLPDGMKVFEEAQRIGFEMCILTKGPYRTTPAWSEKVDWVRTNLPVGVKVTITEDKSHTYGTMLCEDWPPYVEGWLEYRPRGLVILLDRPYNRHISHPQIVRYNKESYETWKLVQARMVEAFERIHGNAVTPACPV